MEDPLFPTKLDESLVQATLRYQHGDIEAFKNILNFFLEKKSNEGQDIIALHNRLLSLVCLAFHSINQGDNEKDARKSAFCYDDAAAYLNECDKIDSEHPLIWISKGMLILSRNRILRERHAYESAKSHFHFVLERFPNFSAAYIGQAIAEFSLGEYQEAIRSLKYVLFLEGSESAPASVRTALGICFFNLDDFTSAKKCFQRRSALKGAPPCATALFGLAMIDKITYPSSTEYLSQLKAAYSVSKTHPLVLNALSEYFFEKKEMQKAEALALNALNYGFMDKGKAFSCYLLGKLYHSQFNFDDAFTYYHQATRFNPEFVAAFYGVAQIYIYRGDFSLATSSLERALELDPNQLIVMKGLSFLYATNPKEKKKAIKLMRSILATNDPNDVETMLELASLVEQSNNEEAVGLYEKTISLLQSSGISVPIELLNNLGVLVMDKNPLHSLELLTEARNMLPDGSSRLVSVNYSIGRALELLGRFDDAIQTYKSIIQSSDLSSTKHLLSIVRLGFIAMDQKDEKTSSDYFKDAIGINESCKEAWSGLAILYLKSKAITLARKTFERILSKIDKHDLYSLLSLGNIHLIIAKHEQRNNKDWQDSHGRALEFFQKCLMLDGNNYYAVNGMAIAVTMKGPDFLSGARDAFLAIRQEEPSCIDAWINLAHTYVEEHHYAAAQGIYEHCLKRLTLEKAELQVTSCKFAEKEKIINDIALYIAKSFYLTGKSVKDGTAFLKAIYWICTITPTTEEEKMALQFNEAISRQEYAATILQKDLSNQAFDDIKSALENLDQSVLILESLCIHASERITNPIDVKIARERIKYCHSLKASAQRQYELHLQKEKERKEAEEEYNRLLEEAEMKRIEEEKKLQQAKEEEEKKIEELRKASREKLAQVQAKWKSDPSNTTESINIKPKGKKKAKISQVLEEEEDASHEENETNHDYVHNANHQDDVTQSNLSNDESEIHDIHTENFNDVDMDAGH